MAPKIPQVWLTVDLLPKIHEKQTKGMFLPLTLSSLQVAVSTKSQRHLEKAQMKMTMIVQATVTVIRRSVTDMICLTEKEQVRLQCCGTLIMLIAKFQ
jgi:hypothetical protein